MKISHVVPKHHCENAINSHKNFQYHFHDANNYFFIIRYRKHIGSVIKNAYTLCPE